MKLPALVISEIYKKNNFVTAAEAVEAAVEADIDDSIKRKRISVLLKKIHRQRLNRLYAGETCFVHFMQDSVIVCSISDAASGVISGRTESRCPLPVRTGNGYRL